MARRVSVSCLRSSGEGGQGTLEMALVTPVVFVLIMACLELGFAVHAYVSVVWAAREAARAGAVYQYQQDCDQHANDENRESGTGACSKLYADNIRDTAARSANLLRGFDKVNDVQIIYTQTTSHSWDTRSGDLVTVEVTYPYHFLTQMLSDRVITMKAKASARIEP